MNFKLNCVGFLFLVALNLGQVKSACDPQAIVIQQESTEMTDMAKYGVKYTDVDWCVITNNLEVLPLVTGIVADKISAALDNSAIITLLSLSEEGVITFTAYVSGLTPELTSVMGIQLSNAVAAGDLSFVQPGVITMTAAGQVVYGYQDEDLNEMQVPIVNFCFNFDAENICNEGTCQVENPPTCVCTEDGDEGTYCDEMNREQLILIIVLCIMVGAALILVTVLCTLVVARRNIQRRNAGILGNVVKGETLKRPMPIGPPVEALDPMMLPHDSTLPPPPKMSLPMPEVDYGLGQDIHGSSGCVAIHQPVIDQMPRKSIADNGYVIESSDAGKAIAGRAGIDFGLGLKGPDATMFRINAAKGEGFSWKKQVPALTFGEEKEETLNIPE